MHSRHLKDYELRGHSMQSGSDARITYARNSINIMGKNQRHLVITRL